MHEVTFIYNDGRTEQRRIETLHDTILLPFKEVITKLQLPLQQHKALVFDRLSRVYFREDEAIILVFYIERGTSEEIVHKMLELKMQEIA